MTEATQPGADVSADPVDRIEALLSAEQEQPSEDKEVIQSDEVEDLEESEPEEGDEPEPDEEEATSEEADEDDAVEQFELEAEQLADMLGIDADHLVITDDGEIKLKTKVDGETGEATLADLVKSYQLEGHVNKKSMELAEQRKSFETQREQASAALAERLTQADQLLTTLERELLGQYNNVDWEALRRDDPAEFAARQQEYGSQYQRIQQMKQQAMQVVQQQTAEANQKMEAQRQEILQKEYQAMLEVIPEWRDESVAQAEKSAMTDYLKENGYSPEEISQLADHRMVRVIRDALMYRKGNQKVETAKKKVKRVPKVQKPGAAKSKAAKAQQQQAVLKQRAKKGDTDALLSLLEGRV